jgi:hypothetical protein
MSLNGTRLNAMRLRGPPELQEELLELQDEPPWLQGELLMLHDHPLNFRMRTETILYDILTFFFPK